jgi:hypothetical protein
MARDRRGSASRKRYLKNIGFAVILHLKRDLNLNRVNETVANGQPRSVCGLQTFMDIIK